MRKLIVFIICFLVGLNLSAQGFLETKVDLDFTETSLENILRDVQTEYEVSFSYGNINLNEKTSIQFQGSLRKALAILFKDRGIGFKEIGNQVVLKSMQTQESLQTQNLKGLIRDSDSESPLFGATITVVGTDPIRGASADFDGYFKIENLPLGRYDLLVNYLGYEPTTIPQVLLTSGKEVYLEVSLKEALNSIDVITVTGQKPKDQALNEMAILSSRSFTVEETKRFAASVSDPARMAQSYAGVTSGGDDISNEIIIRGNSSKGLLWRLEGIEVPNPNHYGSLGSGGGGISMISSNMLSTSDFFTSAFPAEYGNATSGVFDLRFRNGNYEKRESSIQIGLLGLEASTEGYFSKKSKASYLINYRYSTLGLLGKFIPTLQQEGLNYQDLSFKINVPTKKAGTFSVFSLGGINSLVIEAKRDTSAWENGADNFDFEEGQKIGMLGFTHKISLSNKTYFKTIVLGSADIFYDRTELLDSTPQFNKTLDDISDFENYSLAVSFLANHKFNAKNTLRVGAVATHKIFKLDYKTVEDGVFQTFFDIEGNTQMLQAYGQWKHRFGENWTLNTGAHLTYLTLNKTWAVDPRLGLKWKFKPNQSLGLAAGLHSKPEHISTYFIERVKPNGELSIPNKNLEMMNAFHLVGAYDLKFAKDFRLKTEFYFQYLYNIPISTNPDSYFSILNSSGVWDVIFQNDVSGESLVSEGTGMNYGIDITLEKFFSNQYYFMVTSSIYNSEFKAPNGVNYPTRYASNFTLNLLGGKEFSVGQNKKNIIGLNGRFVLYGGNRDTEIDLAASRLAGEEVALNTDFNGVRGEPYYRLDLGFSYRINGKKVAHSLLIDVQNVTNHFNISTRYYDPEARDIVIATQNGAFPIISYKIEF